MKLNRILILTFFAFTLISCGGAEERKAVYLERAITSMEAGDYDKARIELRNVLQIDPKDGLAHYTLGQVYVKQQEYRKAYSSYLRAEEFSPELLDNHAKLGNFYLLLMNEVTRAQKKVDLILSKEPENSAGLLLSAAIEVKNKNNDKAIKIVKDVLTRDPKHIDSIIFLALMHLEAKRYSDAIDLIDTVITDQKNNEELNKLLASALMLNKDFDRAELLYKDFLERNPDSSASYNNMASFYNEMGDIVTAEKYFQASYDNNPDDVDRQTILIKYIKTKKGNDEAINALQGLITKHKEQGSLRIALGELYVLGGDLKSAIEVYQKAAVDFPEDSTGVDARVALAFIYIQEKDYDKAETILEETLSISPNDPDVNFLNAKFALINKDYEKAIISLRIVTKEAPENIEAFVLLAQIYQTEGNDEQVKKTLSSAYNNNRSTAEALLVLSKFHLSKDIKQAEKIIDDYNSLRENDYEGLSIKSAILNKNKNFDEAQVIAEKLMELFPDKPNGYLQIVPFYGQTADVKKAVSVLEKGYLNVKDNRNILLVLTSLQTSEKQYDLVAKRITNELKVSPDDDVLKLLLAKVYLTEKKVELATSLLLEIVESKSPLEDAYLLLASLHQTKKDLTASIAVLMKGKEVIASSVKIPFRLASVYEFEGDYEKAIAVYRELNEAYPDAIIITNNYAAMLTDYGNGESDLDVAKTLVLKLEKTSQPVFLDTVGWIYFKSNDLEKAIQFLTKVVEKAPKVNVFNYHLGMVYKAKGDKLNAKIYLEKSLADEKTFREQEAAKKALAEL